MIGCDLVLLSKHGYKHWPEWIRNLWRAVINGTIDELQSKPWAGVFQVQQLKKIDNPDYEAYRIQVDVGKKIIKRFHIPQTDWHILSVLYIVDCWKNAVFVNIVIRGEVSGFSAYKLDDSGWVEITPGSRRVEK